MAKRYIRLNWQDRPSVATPINQVNLNKMDKGIDDIDNAVEDLYATKLSTANIANNLVTTVPELALDARQGKTLKDGLDTLNNKLGKFKARTFLLSSGSPITFEYDTFAYLVGARQASSKKATYFFDGASGVSDLITNTDFTVTCTNKIVSITSSNATAIHVIVFII